MRIIVILALLLALGISQTLPTQSQDNSTAHVNTCVSHDVSAMWLYPNDAILYPKYFTQMSGEFVQWLGYAPRSLDNQVWDGSAWIYEWQYLERTGQGYAYGLNLYETQSQSIVYLYEHSRPVERWTITELKDNYFVMRTSLEPFARSDGTAYDYHGWRSDCLFLIDKSQMQWLTKE